MFRAAVAPLIAGIPQKPVHTAGSFLGLLAYILDRRHRRIVRRNLQFTHPEWSQDRIRELSRAVFQNVGVTILETCQILSFSREDVLKRVRIRREQHLLNAMENPRGAIIISAHLGNWEMAHIFASCYAGIPLVLVARELRLKALSRRVHRLRTRFGNVILDKSGAVPQLSRALHQGRPVGLLIDQGTTRSEGVEISFLGGTVSATPAAALLARRHRCPVVPAFCIREADGGLTFIVEPPLALKRTKDLRADVRDNTQMMNDAVENAVRAYPEQWFWFHKRWKRHHPELYPEDLAKRQRRREKRKARSCRA
ncbi:MAG: lysophospholipid acyltransferase family protein [Syntrophobacteria bacterium]